jgi:hypothetical protein
MEHGCSVFRSRLLALPQRLASLAGGDVELQRNANLLVREALEELSAAHDLPGEDAA